MAFWIVMTVVALLIALFAWRLVTGWTPSRNQYPIQGIAIGAANGAVDWPAVAAQGVNFAYVEATSGTDIRDPQFADNIDRAAKAGLRVGAVHKFDLCRLASDQATLFITTVPRSVEALPTVVTFAFAPGCKDRPARTLVLSEISTFLNLVETHSGKPVILKIAADFEALYRLSDAIDRTFWLVGDIFPPNYAARPWVMWTANQRHRITGISGPVDWVVVRP